MIRWRGEWRLFYDHWCANRLDIELFWGPEEARAYIEQRQPVDDRDDWLDAVWCEGAALLDCDSRQLLWFGGEEILGDVPLRRAFLALMASRWRGWEIEWAAGGIVEIGGRLGFPAKKFLDDRRPDPDRKYRAMVEYPEDNNILLTIRQRGRTTATRVYGDEESIEVGSSQLSDLLALPREEALEWRGRSPIGGLHLDVDERALFYWHANPTEGLETRVTEVWPGWRCRNLVDWYEVHLSLADGASISLPRRSVESLQRSLIESLRRNATVAAANPARKLLSRLEGGAVNPWTDEARGSVGAESRKLRILDELERQLPVEGAINENAG